MNLATFLLILLRVEPLLWAYLFVDLPFLFWAYLSAIISFWLVPCTWTLWWLWICFFFKLWKAQLGIEWLRVLDFKDLSLLVLWLYGNIRYLYNSWHILLLPWSFWLAPLRGGIGKRSTWGCGSRKPCGINRCRLVLLLNVVYISFKPIKSPEF